MQRDHLITIAFALTILLVAGATGWRPEFQPWIWPAMLGIAAWAALVLLTRPRNSR